MALGGAEWSPASQHKDNPSHKPLSGASTVWPSKAPSRLWWTWVSCSQCARYQLSVATDIAGRDRPVMNACETLLRGYASLGLGHFERRRMPVPDQRDVDHIKFVRTAGEDGVLDMDVPLLDQLLGRPSPSRSAISLNYDLNRFGTCRRQCLNSLFALQAMRSITVTT